MFPFGSLITEGDTAFVIITCKLLLQWIAWSQKNSLHPVSPHFNVVFLSTFCPQFFSNSVLCLQAYNSKSKELQELPSEARQFALKGKVVWIMATDASLVMCDNSDACLEDNALCHSSKEGPYRSQHDAS